MAAAGDANRSRSPARQLGLGAASARERSGSPGLCALGVARDTVAIGSKGTEAGFKIARAATGFGFGVASALLKGPATLIENQAGPNRFSQVLNGADQVVGVAKNISFMSQDVAKNVALGSLAVTKMGLEAAGARDGELLRLTLGSEEADAILALNALVQREAHELTRVPAPDLIRAARAWGLMQRAAGEPGIDPPGPSAELPDRAERWLRFACAAFGQSNMSGLVDGVSLPGLATAVRANVARVTGGAEDVDVAEAGGVALRSAGVPSDDVEVLLFEESHVLGGELHLPSHMVAVDRTEGAVVVAMRGTGSLRDVLSDLDCQPEAFSLGGCEGHAHAGMLRAARKLDELLSPIVEDGFVKLGGQRRVIVVGHSLGAGVAALLTALWIDSGRFPGSRLRCLAFACPQVLDELLASALQNVITSFVFADDIVPRLSLATARDLRGAMLCLLDPVARGLSPDFSAQEILGMADRDEHDRLAAAHGAVRRVVGSAPGRMYPPGRLVHLAPGRAPKMVDHDAVDAMLVTMGMAAAHMPRQYLRAIQEAPSLGSPRSRQ